MNEIRIAWRTLARRPLFTLAAVVTLALGIGLNSAVFSAVHALLLRPLPGVVEPDRLVQLYRAYPGDFVYGSNSIPHYLDLRERGDAFSGVALWTFLPVNLSTGDHNEMTMGELVSANFFEVLGVRPVLGRTFLPEEDVGIGAHPVAVLSHSAWRTRFGGDPGVVGREIRLNGQPYTVIGVAPAEFQGPVPIVTPVLWAPLTMQPQLQARESLWESRGNNQFNVVARLKPGVTVEQARESMGALHLALAREHPEQYEGGGITVVPQTEAGIHPQMAAAQVGISAVIMGVVALLLLLACVNVANLFLARARERRREMAIRLSVGARRSDLIRQLLTESLLLSLIAGVAALGLARVAIGLANGIRLPIDFPIAFGLELNGPVLLFTFGVAVAAGALFGLVPALDASRPELVSGLKSEAGTETSGIRRSRLSRGLVVAQIALSLVLLVSAGLFLRSLERATRMEKGMDAENLLIASVDPSLQGYDAARTRAFFDELVGRVRALPGVRAAAVGEIVPLGLNDQQTGLQVPGYTFGENERQSFDYNFVGDGYFEAMGVPIVQGRGFTAQDRGQDVAVVNQRMAERFWPGQSPIGRTVRRGQTEYRIIGVTATGKYRSLGESPLEYIYFPIPESWNSALTLHVRTAGDPESLLPLVRSQVRALDSTLPIYDAKTMTRHLGIALLPARLAGAVLGIFGALGLLLAAIGTYGVLAYSVAQRTREIGIRTALGAERGRVVGLVVGQMLRLVGMGLAAGLVGAVLVGRLVERMLYGISGLDPIAFAGVSALLVAAGFLAAWLPARRAARVDPVVALRGG